MSVSNILNKEVNRDNRKIFGPYESGVISASLPYHSSNNLPMVKLYISDKYTIRAVKILKTDFDVHVAVMYDGAFYHANPKSFYSFMRREDGLLELSEDDDELYDVYTSLAVETSDGIFLDICGRSYFTIRNLVFFHLSIMSKPCTNSSIGWHFAFTPFTIKLNNAHQLRPFTDYHALLINVILNLVGIEKLISRTQGCDYESFIYRTSQPVCFSYEIIIPTNSGDDVISERILIFRNYLKNSDKPMTIESKIDSINLCLYYVENGFENQDQLPTLHRDEFLEIPALRPMAVSDYILPKSKTRVNMYFDKTWTKKIGLLYCSPDIDESCPLSVYLSTKNNSSGPVQKIDIHTFKSLESYGFVTKLDFHQSNYVDTSEKPLSKISRTVFKFVVQGDKLVVIFCPVFITSCGTLMSDCTQVEYLLPCHNYTLDYVRVFEGQDAVVFNPRLLDPADFLYILPTMLEYNTFSYSKHDKRPYHRFVPYIKYNDTLKFGFDLGYIYSYRFCYDTKITHHDYLMLITSKSDVNDFEANSIKYYPKEPHTAVVIQCDFRQHQKICNGKCKVVFVGMLQDMFLSSNINFYDCD